MANQDKPSSRATTLEGLINKRGSLLGALWESAVDAIEFQKSTGRIMHRHALAAHAEILKRALTTVENRLHQMDAPDNAATLSAPGQNRAKIVIDE